jgi:porphobilinogen synthase
MFVCHGKGVKNEISSMPGNYQQSIDNLVKDCEEVKDLGIPAVILFGIPEHKDEVGSEGYSDEGIVQHAIKAIKHKMPDLTVITDVCLCEYTSHGHCGVIKTTRWTTMRPLNCLPKSAFHAKAGATWSRCRT